MLASSSHQSRTTTKTVTVTPLLRELPPPTNSILNHRPPTINLQWLLPTPYLLPAVLPSKYTRNYYAEQLPVTRTSGLHCFAGQSDRARSCCGYSHTVIMAQSMDLYSQKNSFLIKLPNSEYIEHICSSPTLSFTPPLIFANRSTPWGKSTASANPYVGKTNGCASSLSKP